MTPPKQKAKQLCDAFYQKLPLEMHVKTNDGDLSWEYNGWKNSKECALIAVDEIIKSNPHNDLFKLSDIPTSINYWELVKKEIEKM